jgi:arginine/lysine/ornithine decarboxylase
MDRNHNEKQQQKTAAASFHKQQPGFGMLHLLHASDEMLWYL